MNDKQMRFFNKETIVYFIAVIVTMTWALTTFFVIAKAFKLVGANADLATVLSIYGTITAVFMGIQNFYFGSTKGSQERSAQMIEMARALPVSPTPGPTDAFKALQERAKLANIEGWETMTEDQLKKALGE